MWCSLPVSALEARLGAPIARERINEKERLALPAPLARVLGRGRTIRALGRLPGSGRAKGWLKRRFGAAADGLSGLTAAETARVEEFVGEFYARDIAFLATLPDRAQSRSSEADPAPRREASAGPKSPSDQRDPA